MRRVGDGRRVQGDAGAGLVGLIASVVVFLMFLLFATHLLIGLYARSVVSGAAFDGAQHIARNRDGGEAGAERMVRAEVGGSFRSAGITSLTDDYVEYTVVVAAPRFLSKTWLPGSADTISRIARVRIERRR